MKFVILNINVDFICQVAYFLSEIVFFIGDSVFMVVFTVIAEHS